MNVSLGTQNSDIRDANKYTTKQVWVEWIFIRQSIAGGFVETRLTEASSIVCYDSAHPTYLETICVHSVVA